MQRWLSWRLTAARVRARRGVTAIEYALIASLIALVIIISVTLVGTRLVTFFTSLAGQL